MTGAGWLPVFRAIAAEVRSRIVPLAGTPHGREVRGTGAGGDQTIVLDAVAEEVVLRHLEGARGRGLRFRLLSEEAGVRDFGGEELLLADPVDGSLNAKCGIPYYAIMLAAAEGERFEDVRLGFVQNLASGEEFYAERGGGAFRNGARLRPHGNGSAAGFEIVQLDAPSPLRAVEGVRPLADRIQRLRILGSGALNLCHAATGGIALQVAPLPVRAFDLAGPLLILKEAGGVATDLTGAPLDGVACTLDVYTTLLASAWPALHAQALRLLNPGTA